jgi:hypothetical protein
MQPRPFLRQDLNWPTIGRPVRPPVHLPAELRYRPPRVRRTWRTHHARFASVATDRTRDPHRPFDRGRPARRCGSSFRSSGPPRRHWGWRTATPAMCSTVTVFSLSVNSSTTTDSDPSRRFRKLRLPEARGPRAYSEDPYWLQSDLVSPLPGQSQLTSGSFSWTVSRRIGRQHLTPSWSDSVRTGKS